MSSKPVALVDLAGIGSNFEIIKEHVAKDVELACVVKDDGYGMGAGEVTETLHQAGAKWFCVAYVQEALELRARGVEGEILVLHPPSVEELPATIRHGLVATIWSLDGLREMAGVVEEDALRVHMELDTGMCRGGVDVHDLSEALDLLENTPHLTLDGIFTHLADVADEAFCGEQKSRFADCLDIVKRKLGSLPPRIHAASSGGILLGKDFQYTMVRPGLALYGAWPIQGDPFPSLKPVLTVKSELLKTRSVSTCDTVGYDRAFRAERDMSVGVIPVGYAHGYSRSLTSDAHVLIRGRKAPVLGRVCMDLTMVDLTEVPQGQEGDEVVLLGRQGDQEITLQDLARWLQIIPYEVLCTFGKLCRRRATEDRSAVLSPRSRSRV